jgi:hypothetical protein
LVSGPDGAVGWSARLLALQQWLQQEQQRHICVVDSFKNTAKACFKAAADSCVHACVLQQQDRTGSSDLSRHLCMRRHVPAIHVCSLADMVLLLHPYAYTCCSERAQRMCRNGVVWQRSWRAAAASLACRQCYELPPRFGCLYCCCRRCLTAWCWVSCWVSCSSYHCHLGWQPGRHATARLKTMQQQTCVTC